jgi:hypothetical protein
MAARPTAAWRLGHWTVQPSRWRSSAHTCAGWWRTPVSRSMTMAIRPTVRSSPVNPLAVAPSSRACSTVTSWASDSRGAGPLGPRLCSATGPPRCQRACQTLTAWTETPSWPATSAWWTPAANSSAARSRRAWSRSRSCCAAGRRGTVGMTSILTRRAARLQLHPCSARVPRPNPQGRWASHSLLVTGLGCRPLLLG